MLGCNLLEQPAVPFITGSTAQRRAWAGWAFVVFFVFLLKNGKCKPHVSLKGNAQAWLYADFQMGYSDR